MRFGDYEVLDTAGSGATGTVYRARDVRSGEVVAVKVLSPDAVAGWEQEAATLRRLSHRNLVRLLETGTAEDGRPWLAQAWVDGVGLDRLLQVHGTLTAEQAVGVLRGALEGLAHAHGQGVVHRDVAPGNVLVDTTGTSMLVDFGIAAPVGASGVRGTPAFLSPETASGAAVGPASDVYSAGAVLHLLLAGKPVFPVADVAAALEAHRTTTPPPLRGHGKGFAELLQRCLAKQPTARPADAGELLRELDEQAERRFGAGWLGRSSVAALVPSARAAGSGDGTPAAAAARETVVLTTGAVSTGAAAVAAAASTAPAATQAPVQAPAPPARPRRRRLPRSGPAVAAAALAAVVVIAAGTTAVVALTGNDPPTGPERTAGTATPTATASGGGSAAADLESVDVCALLTPDEARTFVEANRAAVLRFTSLEITGVEPGTPYSDPLNAHGCAWDVATFDRAEAEACIQDGGPAFAERCRQIASRPHPLRLVVNERENVEGCLVSSDGLCVSLASYFADADPPKMPPDLEAAVRARLTG